MTWYDHEDRTKPVIDPRTQIASKYPDMEIPELPPRAVVFCLGKGLPVLKEHFPCHPIMEKLPGFITHSEVLGIEGVSGLCFLHGGYASPQIACTIETLHVLGVKEVYLVGLCGGFAGHLSVGDILLPERIRSEEGTSLHYLDNPAFANVTPPCPLDRIGSYFLGKGYRVFRDATVTTDAVYRQTYHKEQLWRDMGCAAVDMEASAFVNVSNLRGMKNAVILMVSDRHPSGPEDPGWQWGTPDFAGLCERYILDCVEWAAGQPG